MDALFLIGRIIFGGFFVFSGINHFLRANEMVPYTEQQGVPLPRLAVLGTGALLLAGGLPIILGFYAWVGALLLLVFLVPTTMIFHRFWGLGDQQMAQMQMVNFMKNIALAGAALIILFVAQEDPGPLSIE